MQVQCSQQKQQQYNNMSVGKVVVNHFSLPSRQHTATYRPQRRTTNCNLNRQPVALPQNYFEIPLIKYIRCVRKDEINHKLMWQMVNVNVVRMSSQLKMARQINYTFCARMWFIYRTETWSLIITIIHVIVASTLQSDHCVFRNTTATIKNGIEVKVRETGGCALLLSPE